MSETFTCPVCRRTSHNPNDAAEGYCGACHGFTGVPLPEGSGLRWMLMQGGSIDAGRLLAEPLPVLYEIISTGEVYVRRGDQYEVAG